MSNGQANQSARATQDDLADPPLTPLADTTFGKDFRARIIAALVEKSGVMLEPAYMDAYLGKNVAYTADQMREVIAGMQAKLDANNEQLVTFAKANRELRAKLEQLEVRYDEVVSEEHSTAELRAQLWEAFDEKKKCYFAVEQYQKANSNLIAERDELRAKLEQEPYCWLYKDDMGECQWFFTGPPEYSLPLYKNPPDLYTSQERVKKLEKSNQMLLDALNAMLTHMGMDEDEWNKPTFDQTLAAIAAVDGK